MFGEETLTKLEINLSRDLKQELRDQGHYLTGALEASINSVLNKSQGGLLLEIEALDYINDLETGIPPEQIGDVHDARYIAGLVEYVRLRFGYTGKQGLKVAVKIANAQAREGMPTKGSYQFSKTGFRTEAIQESYDNHALQNEQIIEDGCSGELDELFNDLDKLK